MASEKSKILRKVMVFHTNKLSEIVGAGYEINICR